MLSTTWRAVGSFTLCVAVACGAGDAGHVRSHPIEGGIGYSLNAAELHFAEVPAESLTHGVALGDTSTWSFPGPSRIVGRWLVVADQRVAPTKLLSLGHRFRQPRLADALAHQLGQGTPAT